MNKSCPTCGKEKPIGEYYKNSARPDGLQSECKDCVTKRRASRKNLYRRSREHAARREQKLRDGAMSHGAFEQFYYNADIRKAVYKSAARYNKRYEDREDSRQEAWLAIALSSSDLGIEDYQRIAQNRAEANYRDKYRRKGGD